MNSQVSYKIASVISNNPFSLNEDTGLLEVTGTIDRESVAFYNVRHYLTCSDVNNTDLCNFVK